MKKGKMISIIVLLIVLVPVSIGLRTTRINSGIPERIIIPPLFDFENIMADILWIKTTQFLGRIYMKPGISQISEEDIANIYASFDRIVTLNPKFTPAYEYGGLTLSVIAPEFALSILERGIAINPEAGWKLPFYAGMIANQWAKDPAKAYLYFDKVKVFPDRPAYVDRFFARIASGEGHIKISLEVWKGLYKNASNQLEKKTAARGLNAIADKILNESKNTLLRQEAQWIKGSI